MLRRPVGIEAQRRQTRVPHVAIEGRLDVRKVHGHEVSRLHGQHHFRRHLRLGVPNADIIQHAAHVRRPCRAQNAFPQARWTCWRQSQEPQRRAQVCEASHRRAADGQTALPPNHAHRARRVAAHQLCLIHHDAPKLELHEGTARPLVLGRLSQHAHGRRMRGCQVTS